MLCDGKNDCTDGSDETTDMCRCPVLADRSSPSVTLPVVCAASNIVGGAKERCLPAKYKCDGYSDCADGSDEKNCTASDCQKAGAAVSFCAPTQTCVSQFNHCNGIVDCPDYSDEDDCDCAVCKSHPYPTFMCRSGSRCLKRDGLCSSTFHCPDLEDMKVCSAGFDPLA